MYLSFPALLRYNWHVTSCQIKRYKVWSDNTYILQMLATICAVLSCFNRVPLLRTCGLWPTRLLCPWDSPSKNTGVGCHTFLQGIFPTQGSNPGLLALQADSLPLSQREAQLLVAQLCLTVCKSMDCSLPGSSSVHGNLQARILEWVAISFSGRSSQPRDHTPVFLFCRRILYCWNHQGSPLTTTAWASPCHIISISIFVTRPFKIYSVSKFQICNQYIITHTMLYLTSPWLINFMTPFTYLPTPTSGNHQCVLCT